MLAPDLGAVLPSGKCVIVPSAHWKPSTKTVRYRSAASRARWIWTLTYFCLCLFTVFLLLCWILYWSTFFNGTDIGQVRHPKDITSLFNLGLGKVTRDLFISGWAIAKLPVQNGVVASVLVANSPQLALSLLYFLANTLVTLMASNREWNRFSVRGAVKHAPKTLRTSCPVGQQQRTYFLQLPFRFAVPLIMVSAILHWLISQSIFLATVSYYRADGTLKEAFAVASCGFSPMGMILVLITGVAMLLVLVGISMIPAEKGMPIVRSCSLAIAANCRVLA